MFFAPRGNAIFQSALSAVLDITLSIGSSSLVASVVDRAIAPVRQKEPSRVYSPASESPSNGSVPNPPLASPSSPLTQKSRGFATFSSPPRQAPPPPYIISSPPPPASAGTITSPPPSYYPVPVIVLAPAPSSMTLIAPPHVNPTPVVNHPPPLNSPPSPPLNPPPPLNLPPSHTPPYPANDTGTVSSPPPRKEANVPPESSPKCPRFILMSVGHYCNCCILSYCLEDPEFFGKSNAESSASPPGKLRRNVPPPVTQAGRR